MRELALSSDAFVPQVLTTRYRITVLPISKRPVLLLERSLGVASGEWKYAQILTRAYTCHHRHARFLGDITASDTAGWYSLISLHGDENGNLPQLSARG